MSLVLDASVAIAWCMEEERTPVPMSLLDQVTEQGAEAPKEEGNVLTVAAHRKRVIPEQRDDLIGFLGNLPVTLDDAVALAIRPDPPRRRLSGTGAAA